MTAPKPKKPETPAVTREEFGQLADAVGKLIGMVQDIRTNPAPAAPKLTPEEEIQNRKVSEAVSDDVPVSPSWDRKAREILGDALDHCEVLYPKSGGVFFTLVIKREKSNAPPDYLERHKADRRTKEIGNEGLEGVEQWCKLVKANLARPR